MYTIFDKFHHGVEGDLVEIAPLIQKYGIEGISVPPELLEDENKANEARECLESLGLKWGLLPTPIDFYDETIEDDDFAEGLETLKRHAYLGEKLGVKYAYNHVWSGSNFRGFEENYEWVLTRIRQVWNVFDNHGIMYGLEFLGPHHIQKSYSYPFINNIAGILALASDVNKRCGFLFDTYHWFCGSASNMGDLYMASKNVQKMVNFHVNDGIAGRSYAEQQDLDRALPLSTGVIDAATPFRFFEENGYEGPVLCESLWPFIDEQKKRPTQEAIQIVADVYNKLKATSRSAG